MHELTAFQYEILAVLAEHGPSKGLTIKGELERQYPKYGEEVNHGRLYPNLDELADMGLLEKGMRDKRTNEYTLTPSGKSKLQYRVRELGGKWNDE